MHNILSMHIPQRQRHLRHIPCRHLFPEPPPGLSTQSLEQTPSGRILKDQVDALVVVKPAQKSQDVGMG
jgi:hypothetical protein